MKENIYWFVGGYIYCIIVTYIINYKGKKKVKKNVDNN